MLQGARRVLGVTLPPLKHFGPLLIVWGTAMLLLFYIRDIGSSVMFFGAFLAMIYVATNRVSFVVIGLGLFAAGASLVAGQIGHISDRIDAWRDPFDPTLYDASGGSYQLAQSLFAQADGGMFGAGFGQAVLDLPRSLCPEGVTQCNLLPAPHTDFIYSVITNELGLVGAIALLTIYLLRDRARLQDRDARARLVLQAAGRRADRGVRAAGLRDRRRRHEAHPADRRDAAVRLLRRLLARRQLRPARAAAARLRTREA